MHANGLALPVDQYARWKMSVHAKAMLEKGDLTAPTCNDCHGNHGATPPGVNSIAFVCGRCHVREAELFRASPKSAGWDRHNDLLAAAPDGKCGTCHDDERSAIQLKQFTGCVICHSNHGIVRPTVAMLGELPETPCAFCHEGVGPLAAIVAEPKEKARHFAEVRAGLLKNAGKLGLKGDARFDWLVDQALALPPHRASKAGEFQRLFDKFRIGKTHYTYQDPETGRDVSVAVRQCTSCHRVDGFAGRDTARGILADTRSVTSMIARSQRILLAAQRGGVEVRSVRPEVDSAVDNQIELEALVHTFSTKGEFGEKRKEALAHAQAALQAGQKSLDELAYRRRGLFIALGVILAALLALALKIRQM